MMHALRALAADLGDPFRAEEGVIGRALFGAPPHAFAVIAPGSDASGPAGLAFCNPVVSTVYGGTCVYVSDLWVAAAARGQSMGRRLLAEAMRIGRDRWDARAMKLMVYADNTGAQAFYRHLGFVIDGTEQPATLSGPAVAALVRAASGPNPDG